MDLPHEQKTNFDTEGFLSDSVRDSIGVFVAEYREWAELFRDINRYSCRVLADIRPTRSAKDLLGISVFYRILTALQSAYLLIERSNDVDSKGMLRNALEALFVLGAIGREGGFAEKFIRADEHSQLKKLRKLLAAEKSDEKNLLLSPDQRAEINRKIESLEARQSSPTWVKTEEVHIEGIAKAGGLLWMYKFLYPYLCAFTHGSPSGLGDHMRIDASTTVILQRGQNDKDAEGNLRLGIFLYLQSLKAVASLFAIAFTEERAAFDDRYSKAIASSDTQIPGIIEGESV